MQSDSRQPSPRKHPCPDCRMCQACAEVRCRACRGGNRCSRRKLSFEQQIELFDSLNPEIGNAHETFSAPSFDPAGKLD